RGPQAFASCQPVLACSRKPGVPNRLRLPSNLLGWKRGPRQIASFPKYAPHVEPGVLAGGLPNSSYISSEPLVPRRRGGLLSHLQESPHQKARAPRIRISSAALARSRRRLPMICGPITKRKRGQIHGVGYGGEGALLPARAAITKRKRARIFRMG